MIKRGFTFLIISCLALTTKTIFGQANCDFKWRWAKQAGDSRTGTQNVRTTGTATDKDGNVYATGYFQGKLNFGQTESGLTVELNAPASTQTFIAKYNSKGDIIWAQQAGSSVMFTFCEANAITADSEGNVYITGRFSGGAVFGSLSPLPTQAFRTDMFLAKYRTDGSAVWAKSFFSSNNLNPCDGRGITMDDNGNVVFTGSFSGTVNFGGSTGSGSSNGTRLTASGRQDIFVSKFDASGNEIWTKQAGSSSPSATQNNERGNDVTVDNFGTIYVVGACFNDALFETFRIRTPNHNGGLDAFIARYASDGTVEWVSKGLGGAQDDEATAVDINPQTSEILVAGTFRGTGRFDGADLVSAGRTDVFVLFLEENAPDDIVIRIRKQEGGTSEDFAHAIIADNQGFVYLAGNFETGANSTMILQYDASGNRQQSKNTGATATSVAKDGFGNLYFGGFFNQTADFESVNLTPKSNGTDMFVARLCNNGECNLRADAGNEQTIVCGSTTVLTGSATGETPGSSITYLWQPADDLDNPTSPNPTTSTKFSTVYTLTVDDGSCTATSTVFVGVEPVSLNVTADRTLTCPGQTVTLTATGGSDPTDYFWTAPDESLVSQTGSVVTARPQQTTTYFVTYGLLSGCFAFGSIEIAVNPTVPVNILNENQTICEGQSVTLQAIGADFYRWESSPGVVVSTSAVFTTAPTQTTTYTVYGDITGACTGVDFVTITVRPVTPLTLTPNSASVCHGGQVNVTASPASSYVWSPSSGVTVLGAFDFSLKPTATTTYTVRATTSGCSTTSTITVRVNNPPTVTATTNSTTICLGGSGANLSAMGGVTYLWEPASSLSNAMIATPVASPTAFETYTVTATDANGCTGTASVSIDVVSSFAVSIAPNNPTICAGSAGVTLTANSLATEFSWAPSTGLTGNLTSNTVVASPSITTTYTVTASGAVCPASTATVTVTVDANSANLTLSTSTLNLCAGSVFSPTTVTASGAQEYFWAPSTGLSATTGSTVTITPTQTMVYTVTGRTGRCYVSKLLQVNVRPRPVPVINAAKTNLCGNESTTLRASGGSAYLWAPTTGLSNAFASTVIATPGVTRTYTLTAIGAGNCTATTTVTLNVTPIPVLTPLPANAVICGGTPANLRVTGATTYTWTPSTGLNTTTGSNVTANPTSTTVYTVTGTTGTCTSTRAVSVVVTSAPNVTLTANRTEYCPGLDATITASGASFYRWLPVGSFAGSTSASITVNPSSTTTYTVEGMAGSGSCVTRRTITITILEPISVTATAANPAYCLGGQTTLTASGAHTYVWASNEALSGTTGATVTANPSLTTTFTVTGTRANCTATATVTVTVHNPPVVILSKTDDTILDGANGTLTIVPAGGAAPYTISVNGTPTPNQTLTGLSAGNYNVSIIDANGCRASNSITINEVITPCIAPASVTVANVSGTGATVSWSSAANALSYSLEYKKQSDANWTTLTNPIQPVTLSNLETNTTYEVRVKSDCGFGNVSATTQATFTTPLVISGCQLPLSAVTITPSSNSARVSWPIIDNASRVELQWRIPGGAWTFMSAAAASLSATLPNLLAGTTYELQARVRCGTNIPLWPSNRLTFTTSNAKAFEQSNTNNFSLSIYPNPARETFTLSVNAITAGQATVSIYDLTGKLLQSKAVDITLGLNTIPINIEHYKRGIHLVKFEQGETLKVVRLSLE